MDSDHGRSQIGRPTHGWDGRQISHQPHRGTPNRDHITIINNTTVINNIHNHNRYETVRGQYYWHEYNGSRYCHQYDQWGFHWYGWYLGSSYFWARYHADNWWWYDTSYQRWLYLHEGRWWYQSPTRVVYIYVNEENRYYRYDESRGGVVTRPDTTPPVTPPPADPTQPTPPAEPAEQSTFYSEDGSRMVQIFGDNDDGFLYDTAETPSFEPKFLAAGVKEVQFSTDNQTGLQILVITEKKDEAGSVSKGFKLFDAQGQPYGVEEPEEPKAPDPTPAMDQLKALDEGF